MATWLTLTERKQARLAALRPLAWCTPGFLKRIQPDMVSLP